MEQLGLVDQLLRRPLVADAAALDHVGGLCERECHVGELLDQEHADAALRDGLEGRHEPLDDDGCEAERELVDEHDPGSRDESLGEDEHLLLAAREQAGVHVPALLELGEELERVGRPARRVLAGERVRRDPEVVLDREVRQEPPPLGDDRHPRGANLLGAEAGEVLVAQHDLAPGRAQQAADREHEARLAGAVRAEQGRHLAGRDLQRHLLDDGPSAAGDGELLEAEPGLGGDGALGAHSSSSVPR